MRGLVSKMGWVFREKRGCVCVVDFDSAEF